MAAITVSNEEVMQLILLFFKENGLKQSFRMVEKESGVRCGFVTEHCEVLKEIVIKGNWDEVLEMIEGVAVTKDTLVLLYETIIMELIDAKEFDIAKCVLLRMSSEVTEIFKCEFKAQFDLLSQVITNEITPNVYYSLSPSSTLRTKSIEERRQKVSYLLAAELSSALPGRLIYLIARGLNSLALNDKNYNMYNGEYSDKVKTESSYAKTKAEKCIHVDEDGSYVTSADFSLENDLLATGFNDGLIELWDVKTLELSNQAQYQVEGNFMFHKEAISALSFSKDSRLLCSGDISASVKVFSVSNGNCLGTFINVHSKAITSVKLTQNNSSLISASLDGTIVVIGLKSMKVLSEINAHSSFINYCWINWANDTYYTASSDGTAKVWNINKRQLIQTIVINEDNDSVNAIKGTQKGDMVYIANQSNTVHLIDSFGKELKTYCTGRKGCIKQLDLSHDENWLYCLDEDNLLFTFNAEHAVVVNVIELSKGIAGIISSPVEKLLAVYSNEGQLVIYY